jgi:hypothetical protein
MGEALDNIGKVFTVLAAVLGTAGYVLVLGAAVLWLRLEHAGLPPEVPVSQASRQELIAMGAHTVAIWVVLAAAFAALAAWIATGDPRRRRFGLLEAGLALTVTVSSLFALELEDWWLFLLPAAAGAIALGAALAFWPSVDTVAALLVPTAVGVALAIGLSALVDENSTTTSIGAGAIFAILVLLAPLLQRWRAREEANRVAAAQLHALTEQAAPNPGEPRDVEPLRSALTADEEPNGGGASLAVWAGRIAAAVAVLVILGVVSVASELDRERDFHRALVNFSNGHCLVGTYITRSGDQIVLGDWHPKDDEYPAHGERIVSIPTKDVVEVQVDSERHGGTRLDAAGCEDGRAVMTAEDDRVTAKDGGATAKDGGATAKDGGATPTSDAPASEAAASAAKPRQ